MSTASATGPATSRPTDWWGFVETLGREEFVGVASDDPLAQSEGPVDLRLFEAAIGCCSPLQGLSPFFHAASAPGWLRPRGRLRTSQLSAAARLAASGAGPAMVPSNVLEPGFAGVAVRLQEPVRRELAVFSRDAARGALLPTFIEALRSARNHMKLIPGY